MILRPSSLLVLDLLPANARAVYDVRETERFFYADGPKVVQLSGLRESVVIPVNLSRDLVEKAVVLCLVEAAMARKPSFRPSRHQVWRTFTQDNLSASSVLVSPLTYLSGRPLAVGSVCVHEAVPEGLEVYVASPENVGRLAVSPDGKFGVMVHNVRAVLPVLSTDYVSLEQRRASREAGSLIDVMES